MSHLKKGNKYNKYDKMYFYQLSDVLGWDYNDPIKVGTKTGYFLHIYLNNGTDWLKITAFS